MYSKKPMEIEKVMDIWISVFGAQKENNDG